MKWLNEWKERNKVKSWKSKRIIFNKQREILERLDELNEMQGIKKKVQMEEGIHQEAAQ